MLSRYFYLCSSNAKLSHVKLTKEQVQHVAKLARLGLSEAEIAKFQTQLSGILDYVEQLNEVNTDNVAPTAQVTGLTNVMREDKVLHSDKQGSLADPAALVACSPLPIEKNQIKVKNVF
ncbi:Asp-tRNA(Asn)/Glu-tRNA(Gln) amidotransferase subunit GatC [Candidatus Peregrinibacteria bacterium]|nr:Asp-tRNA(Asn)/Glu-tRNA(Gln) amidotransferase subunit GatC [Candidatus Peregrinibacteria bacterium]